MTDEIVVLSHDPFARVEIIRICEETSESCAWCGSKRRSGKMFYYGVWEDGLNSHPYYHSKPFCSKSCHDSYYA